MSQSADHSTPTAHGEEPDTLKALMPVIPVVLPAVGGALMLLLAFIAVYMA